MNLPSRFIVIIGILNNRDPFSAVIKGENRKRVREKYMLKMKGSVKR